MGTGVPFNDAYRYMDWLLTVPLLLIEILLVMKLEPGSFNCKAWTLGLGSALMIVSGYYGELVVTGDLAPRWHCWIASMVFFLYIVYELLLGLSAATNAEEDPSIKGKIRTVGGLDEAKAFFKSLKVFTLAESLGGYESLAELPALMTHASVSAEERAVLGIGDNLIRLSVGLEDVSDII